MNRNDDDWILSERNNLIILLQQSHSFTYPFTSVYAKVKAVCATEATLAMIIIIMTEIIALETNYTQSFRGTL